MWLIKPIRIGLVADVRIHWRQNTHFGYVFNIYRLQMQSTRSVQYTSKSDRQNEEMDLTKFIKLISLVFVTLPTGPIRDSHKKSEIDESREGPHRYNCYGYALVFGHHIEHLDCVCRVVVRFESAIWMGMTNAKQRLVFGFHLTIAKW